MIPKLGYWNQTCALLRWYFFIETPALNFGPVALIRCSCGTLNRSPWISCTLTTKAPKIIKRKFHFLLLEQKNHFNLAFLSSETLTTWFLFNVCSMFSGRTLNFAQSSWARWPPYSSWGKTLVNNDWVRKTKLFAHFYYLSKSNYIDSLKM